MEQFLREWRKEALNKNQHDAAIFIGDKLLALTNSDHDAWWLAQVHFNTGNYTRAQSFLQRNDLTSRNPSCKYLSALCLIKQAKYDEALQLLGDKNPTHLFSAPGSARKKYQHVDGNGIVARARTDNRTDRLDRSLERAGEDTTAIKAEAGMCYLRGLCHSRQNAFDRAKECYKDACRIDVQCFEGFDALMKNSLMSPTEEWEFLESLNFEDIRVGDGADASMNQQAADFTRMLYTTRLSKYSHPKEFTTATETLSTHYNLSNNADILLSRAGQLYTQSRFRPALSITSQILEKDPENLPSLPLHLSCLYELGDKNALYLLSHTLASSHPNDAVTYFAIGTYYLCISQISSARQFFSKASILDAHFGPAWTGFGHTFALEGEHDQAISAYSTAARLFQGSHLPVLFLGMENLRAGNLRLAREYLNSAWNICQADPLLLNELGVVFYQEERMDNAIDAFQSALTLASEIEAEPSAFVGTRANLAHALRRAGRLKEALSQFDEVLRLQAGAGSSNIPSASAATANRDTAAIFTAKALTLLELEKPKRATVALHEALSISPQDPIATDLLARAMDALADEPVLAAADEEEIHRKLEDVAEKLGLPERKAARERAFRQRQQSEQEALRMAEQQLQGMRRIPSGMIGGSARAGAEVGMRPPRGRPRRSVRYMREQGRMRTGSPDEGLSPIEMEEEGDARGESMVVDEDD